MNYNSNKFKKIMLKKNNTKTEPGDESAGSTYYV